MDMSNLNTTHQFDVLIVGSGGAGLSLALSLPDHFKIAEYSRTTGGQPALGTEDVLLCQWNAVQQPDLADAA